MFGTALFKRLGLRILIQDGLSNTFAFFSIIYLLAVESDEHHPL